MDNKYFNLSNYSRKLKQVFFYALSIIIRPLETWLIRKYSQSEITHQPVFIIGAPRTGSTILYQALTNAADVLYIDNLAHKLYKNLFFGVWLSQKLFGKKPHNNFKADHGYTAQYGMHAPSECGDFWYRWLPKDRHFIDEEDITEKMVAEIRDEITAITNYHNKPILFKNLNAGQRLRLLKKAFPNARFIFIVRDAQFTVNSILNARKKKNIHSGEWWSIKPKNYNELLELNELEMCMAQVFILEKQIKDDLELLYNDNFKKLKYSQLSKESIIKVIKWLNINTKDGCFPKFFKDDISKIDPAKQDALKTAALKYGIELGFNK